MVAATIGAIFGRRFLFVTYIFVTLITCGEIFFSGSFGASGAGLLGSALCCLGTASFVGSSLARREKNYSPRDLAKIGAIAAVVSAAGIALLAWSGFHFKLFDVVIEGPVWAAVGIIVAMVATKRKHAL
jgi:drug/metabolite transporter (DMT)-like permease